MDRPRNIMEVIATFFGAGNLPKAPGTFGTIAALPLYLVIRRLPFACYLAITALLTIIGAVAAGKMEHEWGKDPSRVVIDEVCGLLVTLISRPARLKDIIIGTALFRFLDIVKPPPVGTIDKRVPGGVGIMADDIAAGIMAALVLHLTRKMWQRS
jgi:phosphatidylglycerophosphatase A